MWTGFECILFISMLSILKRLNYCWFIFLSVAKFEISTISYRRRIKGKCRKRSENSKECSYHCLFVPGLLVSTLHNQRHYALLQTLRYSGNSHELRYYSFTRQFRLEPRFIRVGSVRFSSSTLQSDVSMQDITCYN